MSQVNKTSGDQDAVVAKKGGNKRKFDSFSTFVYRMIKGVEPALHVNMHTLSILDDMGHKFLERLMGECVRLVKCRKVRGASKNSKPLISSSLCALAVQNMITEVTTGPFATYKPVDSFKVAIRNEGKKGVRLWETYTKSNSKDKQKFSEYAKLVFPLGRVERMMKRYSPRHFALSKQSKVFVAFALQYFYSEIIEMSCEKTKSSSISTITPAHLNMAIRDDLAVSAYFANDSLVRGHVMPGIHTARLVSVSSFN